MLKKEIINLFYDKHLKRQEISEKFGISPAYVTKIVKQDSRYNQEKVYRKKFHKDKKMAGHKKLIKKQRENKKIDDNYSVVQSQHNQAVNELSKSSHLTNESYRKWNYSAYKYNPLKKRYEFDERLGRSSDVPKYIKER